MATFAQAQAKNNPKKNTPLKLSVGHDHVLNTICIDYSALENRQWVMTVLNGAQFGFQIHAHPLRLAEPEGFIVHFVDDKGKPVSTDDGDSGEDMSIMDGSEVVKTLRNYIGDGEVRIMGGKLPPLVRIIEAPINTDMLR